MSADAKSKAYRAVPPVEFVASVDRRRHEALSSARAALEAIKPAAPDDAVYGLTSVEQAYERAEALIGRSTEILLFDLYPGPFGRLTGSLEGARRRGVRVAGLIYEEPDASLSDWVFATINHEVAGGSWPGQGMILVADAREHLVSLISKDQTELLNGVWSDSTYLSCVQHSGLRCEIRLNLLLRQHDDLIPSVSLFGSNAPGLRELAPFKDGEP